MFPPSSQKRPKFNQKLEQYQTCFKKISGGTLKLTFLGHQNASIILIPKIFSERGLSPLSPPPKLARASETCKIYLFISHVLGKKYDHEKRGGGKNIILKNNIHPCIKPKLGRHVIQWPKKSVLDLLTTSN